MNPFHALDLLSINGDVKDYRTTVGGFMVAAGAVMIQIQSPDWIPTLGASFLAVGGLVLGVQAKDKKGGE